MKAIRAIAAAPVVLLAAGCGGESLQASPSHNAAVAAAPVTGAHVAAAPATAGPCRSSQLALHLRPGGAAAGSRYEAIVFTNTSTTTCTLTGYPGVSFVAPHTGTQVGTAASRNPQHPSATVTLAQSRSASARLQTVNYANFSPADCRATTVSGLRVYPPGERAAIYLPFDHAQRACSSRVEQLAVDSVVAGSAG